MPIRVIACLALAACFAACTAVPAFAQNEDDAGASPGPGPGPGPAVITPAEPVAPAPENAAPLPEPAPEPQPAPEQDHIQPAPAEPEHAPSAADIPAVEAPAPIPSADSPPPPAPAPPAPAPPGNNASTPRAPIKPAFVPSTPAQGSNPLRPKITPGGFPRPGGAPTAPGRPGGPPPPRAGVPPAPNGAPRPPRPAQSAEEKTGAKASEPIAFDFDRAPLTEVITAIAKLTGRNFQFDFDPGAPGAPGGNEVTIITHDKIPPEMAYDVLASVLQSRGYTLTETLDGKLIRISPPQQMPIEKTKLEKGAKAPASGYDLQETHIINVQYADASDLMSALKLLGSAAARIDAYVPTNTLIITDTADGLRRMFTFLEQTDIPGFDSIMEIFTLEYARAEVLSGQIEQVLQDNKGQKPTQRGAAPVPPKPPVRGGRPAQQAATSQTIGNRDDTLRLVADERLNALIVVASESMMERVRDLVKRLDTPTPYEANNLHIYELLNADAQDVEAAVQPLIGGSSYGSTSTSRARSGFSSAGRNNSQNSRYNRATANATQRNQQRPATPGAAGAAGGQGDLLPFEQSVQVNRYDQTNSLLIVASPQDYKILEAFIARLDVPQRQVAVNAAVMDVTITNDFGLEVDAAQIQSKDYFAMSTTNNISKLATTAQTLATPGALGLGLLGLAKDGGITTGIFDDLKIDLGNGQKVTVPFVPFLIKALEKLTDVEVLSEPSLVTVDNEEAQIVVGQEVPFITATQTPPTTAGGQVQTGVYGGYTRVERQEVGVKLRVTPQISEGDNVLLEISIEVSDTDATQIGTVDILGPTTNKTTIDNKVLVKDGFTAVIAGLIRDTAKHNNSQTPILGDLPGVGWLFRNKSQARDKRNLVVLVTPHIIKEGIDYERVTQYKMNEYHESNIEQLLRSGNFFKKVKNKYRRDKHGPTFDKAESLTGIAGESHLGRGDMAR